MTPRSRKPVMVLTTTTSSTDQNPSDLSGYPEPVKHNDDNNDETENDDDTDEEDIPIDSVQQHKRFNANDVIPQTEIINEDATSLGGYSEIFKRQHLLQNNERLIYQNTIDLALPSHSQTYSYDHETKQSSVLNNISNTDALSENFK